MLPADGLGRGVRGACASQRRVSSPTENGGGIHYAPPLPPAHSAPIRLVPRTQIDFTGPQYGIDDTLPSTGTPFWRSCVPRGRAADAPCALPGRGFELVGTPQAFSEPRLPQSALDNQMHAHIGLLIRDAALGVLEHRIRTRSPS